MLVIWSLTVVVVIIISIKVPLLMLFVLLCTAVAEMLSLISLTFMSSVFINIIFITFSPRVVDVVKCP